MNVLGLLALVVGGLIFAVAQSALHEIEGFILFLIAAVFFVGGGIIRAINKE